MEISHSRDRWKQATDKTSERWPAAALPDRYSIRRKGEGRELGCSVNVHSWPFRLLPLYFIDLIPTLHSYATPKFFDSGLSGMRN